METMNKEAITEQQKKDIEAFAQLPEFVRALLLAQASGMIQGAALADKLAG